MTEPHCELCDRELVDVPIWYCDHCERDVHQERVTYNEVHESCGQEVRVLAPNECPVHGVKFLKEPVQHFEYAFEHDGKLFTSDGEEVTDELTQARIEQTQPDYEPGQEYGTNPADPFGLKPGE